MVKSFTYIGESALLTIVHARDGNFALGHVIVVIDVVGQQTLGYGCPVELGSDNLFLFF